MDAVGEFRLGEEGGARREGPVCGERGPQWGARPGREGPGTQLCGVPSRSTALHAMSPPSSERWGLRQLRGQIIRLQHIRAAVGGVGGPGWAT